MMDRWSWYSVDVKGIEVYFFLKENMFVDFDYFMEFFDWSGFGDLYYVLFVCFYEDC